MQYRKTLEPKSQVNFQFGLILPQNSVYSTQIQLMPIYGRNLNINNIEALGLTVVKCTLTTGKVSNQEDCATNIPQSWCSLLHFQHFNGQKKRYILTEKFKVLYS